MGEKHAWHWNANSELRSSGFHGKDFTNGVSPASKQNYFYTTIRDHAIFKAKDSFHVKKNPDPFWTFARLILTASITRFALHWDFVRFFKILQI